MVEGFENEAAADAFVHAIARNWREAGLTECDRALCEYAEKLTLRPSDMAADDVERLRAVGLDDRAIHDATQIVGYFNYINRVAEALGVEPEAFIRPWGQSSEGATVR